MISDIIFNEFYIIFDFLISFFTLFYTYDCKLSFLEAFLGMDAAPQTAEKHKSKKACSNALTKATNCTCKKGILSRRFQKATGGLFLSDIFSEFFNMIIIHKIFFKGSLWVGGAFVADIFSEFFQDDYFWHFS